MILNLEVHPTYSFLNLPQDIEVPRKFMWPVPIIREQGYFGTCVGFGAAMLKNIQETAQKDYVEGGFSPLFIYSLCKQQDRLPRYWGYIYSAGHG